MKHLKSDDQRRDLFEKYMKLRDSGMRAPEASKQLGIAHSTMMVWQKKFSKKSLPMTDVSLVRPIAKKSKKTDKVVLLLGTPEDISQFLRNYHG